MSSTEPDNTNTDGEQGADTTNLPVFGPPFVDDLEDQLDAQFSEKRQQHLVFVAQGAKIEEDYQAALTSNAGPSTLRQYEEAKQAHETLHSRFLREFIELGQQVLAVSDEARTYWKEEDQRLEAEFERLKAENMEKKAKRKEAKKKKQEKARVEKEKKRMIQEQQRLNSVLDQKNAAIDEKNAAIDEKNAAIDEKNAVIEKQNAVIEEQNAIWAAQEKRIAVLMRENAVLVVAQEALEIENEVMEARNKIEDAHVARWDGIFGWYEEALLRYRVYKMLEDLGMHY